MLIATAGHVDHGKTTLVNALTGVDTDRLPEEKARGLTIDLGFAYRQTESGRTFGFVDVPGHERFVRNMAAGVGAIDVALLVVAADDGPMPQTREHLAILHLFGIERAIVAVTRTDLVDADRLAEAHNEIAAMLANTALSNAKIINVCAPDGTGLDELTAQLEALADSVERSHDGYFRLAIDRSFSVHGAGTIITGAVFSGEVKEGDTIRLLPGSTTARVRSIHADNKSTQSARTGQRAALNLVGVQNTEIRRGQWACSEALDGVTQCADVEIRLLDSETRGLRHWTPVHISSGSGATTGRVALYDVRTVEPGGHALGQLVLDDPTHLIYADRFIVRDQSAMRTIGGGHVIDPFARRHRSFRRDRLPLLELLNDDDHQKALAGAIDLSTTGIDLQNFATGRGLSEQSVSAIAERVGGQSITTANGEQRLVSARMLSKLSDSITHGLQAYHDSEPWSVGCEPEILARSVSTGASIFYATIDTLVRGGQLARQGVRIRLASHTPKLDPQQEALLEQLLVVLKPDLIKPPPLSELAEHCKMPRDALSAALDPLARSGHVIRVAENRVFHPEAIDRLADVAQALDATHRPQGFDAKVFRDASKIGRNLTIDVLEYFDSVGLTRRLGDRRTFRRPAP